MRRSIQALVLGGMMASLLRVGMLVAGEMDLAMKGKVVSVDTTDPSSVLLNVEDRYGVETPIFLSQVTKIMQGDNALAASDLPIGSSVEVEYYVDSQTSKRQAVSVKVSAPPSKPASLADLSFPVQRILDCRLTYPAGHVPAEAGYTLRGFLETVARKKSVIEATYELLAYGSDDLRVIRLHLRTEQKIFDINYNCYLGVPSGGTCTPLFVETDGRQSGPKAAFEIMTMLLEGGQGLSAIPGTAPAGATPTAATAEDPNVQASNETSVTSAPPPGSFRSIATCKNWCLDHYKDIGEEAGRRADCLERCD